MDHIAYKRPASDTPSFCIVAPEATAEALRRGAFIAYPQTFGFVWDAIVGAVARLAKVDVALAKELIHTLSLIAEIFPGMELTVIDRMDPKLAQKNWPELQKGNAAQRRTLKKLIDIALRSSEEMRTVAEAVQSGRKR